MVLAIVVVVVVVVVVEVVVPSVTTNGIQDHVTTNATSDMQHITVLMIMMMAILRSV